ncbi:MAG: M20/M25/M40 family metallo-hydrolase [Chloroflexi bacterium]|nr:M20/M25/M40 family metallo-hydrolase [Chloroflexota bacterium]
MPILLAMPTFPRDPVDVLRRLAACPTAPYHEERVAGRITELCRTIGLTCEADAFGNLIAWHRGGRAGAGGRPVAFNAHMDHAALEVADRATMTGRLLGGGRRPRECFERPVTVIFVHEQGETRGRILGYVDDGAAGSVRLEAEASLPAECFGTFDVGPWREEDGRLYQTAADDLAGCAAILCMLEACVRTRVASDVAAVFTRAEEVGLVGATLVARQRRLPPETIVVSLEASRELPGGQMGEGPVIRVGDRAMAFHPDGEALLRAAHGHLVERNPDVRVQRQLMSGGTCEATAYQLAGYTTAAVALPLGNYHNAGPNFTIAAEYVDADDLRTGVDLLVATAEVAGMPLGEDPTWRRLNAVADEAGERLRETAGGFRQ